MRSYCVLDAASVSRASPSTTCGAFPQSERKRNRRGSRAIRTTTGSISKNVQFSRLVAVAGKAAGAKPDDGDLSQSMLCGTGPFDNFRNRATEIVIGQGLRPAADQGAVGLRNLFGAMNGGAVIQDVVAAARTLRFEHW